MSKIIDIRNIINPHRNCGSETQLSSLVADSAKMEWPAGENYVQTKNGNEIVACIASGRKPLKSIIRAMWMFNLAPADPKVKAAYKRKMIEQSIRAIHAGGFVFREAATGRQSNDAADLVAMTHQASKMITDYAKGSAGQPRKGRPCKVRAASDVEIMRRIWGSRHHKKVEDTLQAMHAAGILRVTRGECYRLFGPRG